jgi:hypothetical protein
VIRVFLVTTEKTDDEGDHDHQHEDESEWDITLNGYQGLPWVRQKNVLGSWRGNQPGGKPWAMLSWPLRGRHVPLPPYSFPLFLLKLSL